VNYETRYLRFVEVFDTGKTKVWDVVSREHGDTLGYIKWFGRWRQYCFFPKFQTVWNKGCLTDLEQFIGVQMEARR
jgi:hypothetical protein